jgi:hypothetical protein
VGNAALPKRDSLCAEDKEVEELRAELWTWFGRRWSGGEHA